jgi:hypothetical protein
MESPSLVNETTLDKSVFGCKSIFDGVYVYEKINPEKLFNIIHTARLIDFSGKRYQGGVGELYKTERDLLVAYQYQWLSFNKTFVSEWFLAKHGWGRISPKDYLSMSVFHRPTRHTLCNDYLVDLDLVNCHYEIILSKMKLLGLPCEYMATYCANVSQIRIDVAKHYHVSKEDAKKLFIRLIYGGSVERWLEENNINDIPIPRIVRCIYQELDSFANIVWEGNQHILNDIIKAKPDYFKGQPANKPKKTVMSFWAQTVERYIQEKAIMHLSSTYNILVNNFIPCQDGFMMLKADFKPEYIDAVNTFIQNELGFVSRMIMKPFDERYAVSNPSINNVFVEFDPATAQDAQYAQYMIDICSDYPDIICTGTGRHMDAYQYNEVYWEPIPINNAQYQQGIFDRLGVWVKECGMKHRHIVTSDPRYFCESDLTKLEKELKKLLKQTPIDTKKIEEINSRIAGCKDHLGDRGWSEFVGLATKIVDLSVKLSQASTRKNVIEIYQGKLYKSKIDWDADPELFAFNNCIMHLPTKSFVKPCKEQYIRTTCGWDWDKEYDMSRVESIRQLVAGILPIEPVRDYYMTYESTGLSGNKIQRVLINTGGGGNGKSILRELKNKAIGDYGMKIPNTLLCSPIKANAPDPVFANMHMKRSLSFSEPDAGHRICSATLKEITGDSVIVGRGLYSSNTSINIIATLSGDCNKIPLFNQVAGGGDDNSLMRRLGICKFITEAVSQEKYDLAEDKTNLNIKQNYAENPKWIDENKQAYFLIMLDYYQRFVTIPNVLDNLPVECSNQALAHLTASCDIMNWFNEYLEKVACLETSEAIPLKSLYERFKTNEVFKTFTKADQRKYSQKYFIDLIENGKGLARYIKGRNVHHNKIKLTVTCLIGHRFIEDVVEDDNMDC